MIKTIFTFCAFLFCGMMLSAQNPAPLEPTATKALLNVVVTDFESNPRANETVIFESKKNGKSVMRQTDAKGELQILLPKGDTYAVKYKSLLSTKESTTIEIPNEEGIMEATLTVQMQSTKNEVITLDIHFETAKAIIRPESFDALDELAAALKTQPNRKIELSGHTDSDGNGEANLTLSKERAAAAKQYLVQKGISPERISSTGYGATKPVASNATEAGKAQNRRTELRILN